MKYIRMFMCAIMTIISMTLMLGGPVSAAEELPYESYTYWTGVSRDKKAVYSKPMFEAKEVIDAASLGTSEFKQINDICTDDKGNTYILDSESRLLIMDGKYRLLKEFEHLMREDEEVSFGGARSVYVHGDGTIIMCDTENARVLFADAEGNLTGIYERPESVLIPEDFQYRPIKAAIDSYGNLFVLSDGCYYGALQYSPEKEFTGFYGANKVKMNISQALTGVLNRIFTNNSKKSASLSLLPYCFVDINIDSRDFVYTATGFTDKSEKSGQIKKLNPGGYNVLNSDSVNFADQGNYYDLNKDAMVHQDILGIDVDSDGFIYCLDSTYGRIFVYDQECRLLTAFGGGLGSGEQTGSFKMASAIAISGTRVLVSDSLKNTVTIFEMTDFGKQVIDARALTIAGEYVRSKELWQDILSQDRQCQLAYTGLARAYLAQGDYSYAMSLARQGYDRDTYAIAFESVRKTFVEENFWLIFSAVIVLAGGIMTLVVVTMRKRMVLVKNRQLNLMLSTLTHPAATFMEIKEKRQGSLVLCAVLALLFYLSSVMKVLNGGFMFNYFDMDTFNSLWVFARSIGLLVLWIIGNWAVCALFSGKGTMKEITVVSCYSLLPMIIGNFMVLILSNLLLPAEAGFLDILQAVMTIFTFLLLTVGTMEIHDYTMGRFIGTGILTVIGIAIIVFLLIMISILFQQFYGFVATIITELTL